MLEPQTTLSGFEELLPRPRGGVIGKDFSVEERKGAKDLRALGLVCPVLSKSSLKVVSDADIPLTGACALKNINRDHDSSWRRGRDSNPRDAYASNGFQDRRFRPLSHLSIKRTVNSLRIIRINEC